MNLTLVTGPTVRPIDIDQAKDHLRLDVATYDDLVEGYIDAAVAYLDGKAGILGRALLTQTWDLRLDDWCGALLELPLPPLQSVSAITYFDAADAEQTWAASNYEVDAYSVPGRVVVKPTATFPDLSAARRLNRVKVRFVCGYGSVAGAVPPPVRSALLLHLTHLYDRREPVIVGNLSAAEVPMGYKALLAPYLIPGFG